MRTPSRMIRTGAKSPAGLMRVPAYQIRRKEPRPAPSREARVAARPSGPWSKAWLLARENTSIPASTAACR